MDNFPYKVSESRRGSADTIVSTISTASDFSSASSEYQVTRRLLNLTQKTHYELVQENGQRRLTAPELTKAQRDRIKGAEIFLGRLPRDCYEDELMPLLEKAGRLLELRLMLDFSGSTRGYAFALYEDAKTARKACSMLDGFEVRPGHRIGAVKSVDNCRLFFGGVPKDKTKEEFMEELSKLMDGIVDIYLYPNSQDRTLNRGFIFVEFKDHRSAAMARRQLIPGRVLLWDHEVAVDWADPEPGEPIDEEIMEHVSALFVRNLSIDIPQQKIREIFQKTTNIPILKLKKINHFAFVHYESRVLAEQAMQIMLRPGGVADLENWEISWAKPIGPIKQAERQRCINEAIMQSKNHKELKVNMKLPRRQSTRALIQSNQNSIKDEPLELQYFRSLVDFVTKNFQAMCFFECLNSHEPTGYIHKIKVLRDNILIFEDYGPVQPTKQLSLNVAVSVAYEKLISLLNYNAYQCEYLEQQNTLPFQKFNTDVIPDMFVPPVVNDVTSQMMHMDLNSTT